MYDNIFESETEKDEIFKNDLDENDILEICGGDFKTRCELCGETNKKLIKRNFRNERWEICNECWFKFESRTVVIKDIEKNIQDIVKTFNEKRAINHLKNYHNINSFNVKESIDKILNSRKKEHLTFWEMKLVIFRFLKRLHEKLHFEQIKMGEKCDNYGIKNSCNFCTVANHICVMRETNNKFKIYMESRKTKQLNKLKEGD